MPLRTVVQQAVLRRGARGLIGINFNAALEIGVAPVGEEAALEINAEAIP